LSLAKTLGTGDFNNMESCCPQAQLRLCIPQIPSATNAFEISDIQEGTWSLGWISTTYLPPYAPELNLVEYIWGYWNQHELPNVCPKDYWHLSEAARRTLRRMRRRPRLITAFWKQSSLWSE
jgi:hypothetical protein